MKCPSVCPSVSMCTCQLRSKGDVVFLAVIPESRMIFFVSIPYTNEEHLVFNLLGSSLCR